ncbi:MAG TPA: L-rhamnose mutarotase [Acidimicrobiales bacterium]|nr:L-rhamnose mutarotase [Acidimicrobiales bacterium]
MQRICFHLRVRPDRAAEYARRHQEVWPEMLQALSETGWRNYSLFLSSDGLLTGYLECDDFDRARAAMAERAVNSRWQAEMAGFFEEGGPPDEQMRAVPEVFHMD